MSSINQVFVVAMLLTPVVGCGTLTAGAPGNLRCEYAVNPIGLDDPSPRLSWELRDERRGAVQTAYRVLAASSEQKLAADEADLWDSGRVESDQSIQVAYAGKPLASRQAAFWKVRVWDADGKPSDWSVPARWEMGLLKADDWAAKWITSAKMGLTERAIPLSDWYWHPTVTGDNKTVFFRTEIDLGDNPPPHHVLIAVSADNEYDLLFNGVRIAGDGKWETVEWHCPWGGPKQPRPGKNVIGLRVKNVDGPAGFTVGLRVTAFGGGQVDLRPDNWVCTDKAPQGWATPKFEPKGWVKAKVVARQGEKPWAGLTQDFDGPRKAFQARRAFTLPDKVVHARAYVTGLGMYELSFNGWPVSDDVFAPGWTMYPKRVQYQTYDVTDLLKAGENVAAAVLGNGWWSSGLGWQGGHERFAEKGENLRLLARFEVECADGSRHAIVTDGAWKTRASPLLENTLYHGETYDARLETPGWEKPGFDDAGWTPAVALDAPLDLLCAQKEPPLRITEQLQAVKITETAPGVHVFDFGQNHSGRCRLTVNAPAGTKIQVRHSEFLKDDGNIDNINYRSARVTDTYVCKGGGTEVWEPKFTYRGFRYAELTGLPGKPAKNTLVSQVLHSAPPMAGAFRSSSELLNRIERNVRWGLRSNLHSVPTDCPQRDERLGWMGDAQAFAPTSCWMMDLAGFYTKWMRDIVDSQGPEGYTTDVCPVIVVRNPARSAWGDAVVVVPWRVYEFYGDRRILQENYEGMRRWVEYLRANSAGNLYEKPTYGDWVPVEKSPPEPVSSAYYGYSTRLLSRIAALLGKADDAAQYGKLADDIAAAFNAKHLNPQANTYSTGTQAMNLLPLAFGIVPPDRRQAVADAVARDAEQRGGHHTTGFLGTPLILPELQRYGHADLAWRILSSKEYPSLGYMIEQGATTIWERWNSDKEGPAMNSHNHFALGAMAQWMFDGLAGVRVDDERPGFKHFSVRPVVPKDLQWVAMEYPSMYGRIVSAWRRDGADLRMDVTVPPNTTATVYVPAADASKVSEGGKPAGEAPGVKFLRAEVGAAVYDVGAGKYRFVSRGFEK